MSLPLVGTSSIQSEGDDRPLLASDTNTPPIKDPRSRITKRVSKFIGRPSHGDVFEEFKLWGEKDTDYGSVYGQVTDIVFRRLDGPDSWRNLHVPGERYTRLSIDKVIEVLGDNGRGGELETRLDDLKRREREWKAWKRDVSGCGTLYDNARFSTDKGMNETDMFSLIGDTDSDRNLGR